MKVILQRDIPKVGKGGDIVTVADGYARNYLFPRAYAVSATGGALKAHTARAEQDKARSANQLAGAQADAGKLENLTLTILGKTNTGSTKLYGSITAQDVADTIAKESGVKVDKRRVGLADPIKTLGEYRVPVRLHNDVSVTLPLIVTTEEEQEKRKAQEAAAAAKAAAEAARVASQASDETTAEEDTGEAADGAEAEAAGETA